MGRLNYNTILAKYKRAGKGNVRLTQSTLFLSKAIDSTKTVYNFDVLETQTATLVADEIRLNLNDEFVITTMGIYLQAELLSGGSGTGIKRLMTYAPFHIDGTVAKNVQNLYAGALQISVNNIVYLDKWDTRKHEFVPRTQEEGKLAVSNVATAAYQAVNGQVSANEFSKNAMFPVEPLITLSGAKKTNITLSLPTALTAGSITIVDNAGNSNVWSINRIGLLVRGLNAQNAASFQN